MAKQLLLGTRNPARVAMLRTILQGTGVQVWTLDALGIEQEVEEDGPSTEANAEKKARHYFTFAGIPTLAIDGGLHIDRFPLEKQPGVLVKRVGGSSTAATDTEMMHYYLRELKQVGGESPGKWTASQALAISDTQVLVYTYTFIVHFTTVRRGDLAPGRALDSLMIEPKSGRYYTELSLEERPYFQATRDFILGNLDQLPG